MLLLLLTVCLPSRAGHVQRPRLTPAEEITPIGESEQSKTPLVRRDAWSPVSTWAIDSLNADTICTSPLLQTDSQMEANIKAFLSEVGAHEDQHARSPHSRRIRS